MLSVRRERQQEDRCTDSWVCHPRSVPPPTTHSRTGFSISGPRARTLLRANPNLTPPSRTVCCCSQSCCGTTADEDHADPFGPARTSTRGSLYRLVGVPPPVGATPNHALAQRIQHIRTSGAGPTTCQPQPHTAPPDGCCRSHSCCGTAEDEDQADAFGSARTSTIGS